MNTKSAEVLSALLAIGVSIAALTAPVNSTAFSAMWEYHMLPTWAFIAASMGLFCLLSTFSSRPRVRAASRFISGCTWGSVILLLFAKAQFTPLFWTSLILFSFDLVTVISRGRASWMAKTH